MAARAAGSGGNRDAPAISEELKAVLRDMGAGGYRLGYQAEVDRLAINPLEGARAFLPARRRQGVEGRAAAGARRRAPARHGGPSTRLRPGGRCWKHRRRPAGRDPAGGGGVGDSGAGDGRRGLRPRVGRRGGGARKPSPLERGRPFATRAGGRRGVSAKGRDGPGVPPRGEPRRCRQPAAAVQRGVRPEYTVLRDEAFEVSGGEVRKARLMDGRDDLREIHVEPNSNGTVAIRLPSTSNCSASGAICPQ